MNPREAYAQLVARLDAFFDRARRAAGDQMRCAEGCADCCARSLCLFPFEVERLVAAALALPPSARAALRARALEARADEGAPCPLLVEDRCLVYAVRPVICRTHGLPLLLTGPRGTELCVCPHNFRGATRLSGEGVLDLDPVNAVLATVNHLRAAETGTSPERVDVAEALCDALAGEGGGPG